MISFAFNDAMVVITGAGAGIGLGIAEAFHVAGARVALGDLRQDAVERAAAKLGEQRIQVNCIAPGYIKLDGAKIPPDFEEAMMKNIPWGRFGTPADVAQAALFLASPAADYVTGEVLSVNGGAFAGRSYLPLGT